MPRYLRVLTLFWTLSIAAELEYAANFLVSALGSVLLLAGSLFTLSLFYSVGYNMAGWTFDQALIVLGLFTFLDGISATFLAPNLNRIVQHIWQGTLDFVLLKPIDSQFWLSTRNVSLWGTPNLLFGLGILVFAAIRLHTGLPLLLRGLAPVLLGTLILYSLWFLIASCSVWFVKIYNATEVLRSLLEAGRYPVSSYPPAHRIVFTFIIPVAFLTTVPAEAMLGRAPGASLLAAAVLAVVLLIVSRLFWRLALRYYTSASS